LKCARPARAATNDLETSPQVPHRACRAAPSCAGFVRELMSPPSTSAGCPSCEESYPLFPLKECLSSIQSLRDFLHPPEFPVLYGFTPTHIVSVALPGFSFSPTCTPSRLAPRGGLCPRVTGYRSFLLPPMSSVDGPLYRQAGVENSPPTGLFLFRRPTSASPGSRTSLFVTGL